MRWRHPMLQQQALLLSTVALLLIAAAPYTVAQETPAGNTAATAAPSPAAYNTAVLNSTAPAESGAASTPSTNGTDNGTTLTVSTVDQPIPPFSGLRSCLPFNILLAAAQENSTAGSNSTAPPSGSNSGRIMIHAEFAVINRTVAAIEDDVLALSLAGGFESRHPINFTVVMPAASQLRYVANYGSGTVVLGPGHNTSSLRLAAPTVGTIQAFNVTADSLSLTSNGVLGSSVSGAFNQAEIITNVATGSVAFSSTTPANLTVQLGGITTVVADVPDGSNITGTAGGLSKVQFTNGSCYVSSETPFPFPAPSIFGPGGFGFAFGNARQQANSNCQLVQAGQLQLEVAIASNPQWTCGVIVDGQLSCLQGANATDQVLQWNIQNTTTVQPPPTAPVVEPPVNVGTLENATSPGPATNSTASSPSPTTDTTGTNGTNVVVVDTTSPSPGPATNTAAATNPSSSTDTAAANNANAGSNTANIGNNTANNAAGNAVNAAGAGMGEGLATVPAPAPAAPVGSPAINVGGVSPSPSPIADPLPAPPSPGAGRKMLQGNAAFGFGLPSAFQGSPFGTTITNPQGTITTGSYTSGPGASSFSSGSAEGTTQTTTSQGGSPPTTTLSTGGVGSDLFNPVVVPSTPPETFAADNAAGTTINQAAGAATGNGTGVSTSSPAGSSTVGGAAGAGGAPSGLPVSVSIRTAGPSGAAGVAVVSTVCSSRQQSLSMLVQPAAEPQRASSTLPVRPGGGAATSGAAGNTGGAAGANGGSGASNTMAATP